MQKLQSLNPLWGWHFRFQTDSVLLGLHEASCSHRESSPQNDSGNKVVKIDKNVWFGNMFSTKMLRASKVDHKWFLSKHCGWKTVQKGMPWYANKRSTWRVEILGRFIARMTDRKKDHKTLDFWGHLEIRRRSLQEHLSDATWYHTCPCFPFHNGLSAYTSYHIYHYLYC